MTIKLMNLEYLLETEKRTLDDTLKIHGISEPFLNELVNLFFNLGHYLNEDYPIESDENHFHIFAYYTYIRMPYTIKSVGDLWLKGYYLESSILLRHVLESLAQLRYFSNHIDEIRGHLVNGKRVTFRTIFNSIIPGFYKNYYGRLLSGFAHGSTITSLFHEDRSSATLSIIIHGTKFNEKHSHFIIKQTLAYGYGLLNYIDIFFPSIISKIDNLLKDRIENLLRELHSIFSIEYLEAKDIDYWNLIPKLIEK